MKTLSSNAGRIIFGLIFLVFGFLHMTSAAMSMMLKDAGLLGASLYMSGQFKK